MELSDGSDAEGEGHGMGMNQEDVNEDDLLGGSDDEEMSRVGKHNMNMPDGSVMINEDHVLESDEEEDFLDLGLPAGDVDDELGMDEGMSAEISPVKVPVRTLLPTEQCADAHEADTGSAATSEDLERHEESDSQNDESVASNPPDEDDDDEDEGESKSQRSRFHSERNPVSVPRGGGRGRTPMFEKPQQIRSLGSHGQYNMHNQHQPQHGHGPRNWGPGRPNGMRQFHRGFNNHRGPRPPHMMMMPPPHMQRGSLLGPRPRPLMSQQGPGPRGFLPPPPLPRHPADSAPILQFSSEIFTDFNTPVNVNQQNQQSKPIPKPQLQATPLTLPTPTVTVSPTPRPGIGIVRPQPVVSSDSSGSDPNKKSPQNLSVVTQTQAPNQKQTKPPLRPRLPVQNNPFFPPPQTEGPNRGQQEAWRGNLPPPRPQGLPNQRNNGNVQGPFTGPRSFSPAGNNNLQSQGPMHNLQQQRTEQGPPMGSMPGFVDNIQPGPFQPMGNIRPQNHQQPPPPGSLNHPFMPRPNNPFLEQAGMSISAMQPGPLPMIPRHSYDPFRDPSIRFMGHSYPPQDFPNQQQLGGRVGGPEMFNMVPPLHSQPFQPRFMRMPDPMFQPNPMQLNIRHQNPFFAEPQQQQQSPPQFHPDQMHFMQGQGVQGMFPHQPPQHHIPLPLPLNNMNQGAQASFQPQYGQGGEPQGYRLDRRHPEYDLEKFGYEPIRKDNKTASEEFIALTNPTKPRMHDRLGPPPALKSAADKQADEIVKIIVETKKEMGIDDEYMRQIEEQKRKRAEILRKKAERWKSGTEDDLAPRAKQSRQDPPPPEQSQKRAHDSSRPEQSKSIYINPAAFKGDLSVLNNNLKKINMSVSSGSISSLNSSRSQSHSSIPATNTITSSHSKSSHQQGSSSSGSTKEPARVVRLQKRPKTILRITKNTKGEILHKEKFTKPTVRQSPLRLDQTGNILVVPFSVTVMQNKVGQSM